MLTVAFELREYPGGSNMTRKLCLPRALLGVMLLVLFTTGCVVVSLNPLFTSSDVSFDPALVGTWADFSKKGENPERWTFRKGENKDYDLTISKANSEPPIKLKAYLLRGEKYSFLDIGGRSDGSQALTIPVHMFARIWMDNDALMLAWLDKGWLETMIRRGEGIPHLQLDDEYGAILFTASTQELQRFIITHIDDPGAFPKSLRFILVRSE